MKTIVTLLMIVHGKVNPAILSNSDKGNSAKRVAISIPYGTDSKLSKLISDTADYGSASIETRSENGLDVQLYSEISFKNGKKLSNKDANHNHFKVKFYYEQNTVDYKSGVSS
jgi:hypothetical protein